MSRTRTSTPSNLASGEEACHLHGAGCARWAPAISGEWVVWADARSGDEFLAGNDIYAFNLTTGEERAICTAKGEQTEPAVSF